MLLKVRIRTFSEMTERRVLSRISVIYGTDASKLNLARSEILGLSDKLKERLNFRIRNNVDSNKIEFAFPTQTIHAQVKSI